MKSTYTLFSSTVDNKHFPNKTFFALKLTFLRQRVAKFARPKTETTKKNRSTLELHFPEPDSLVSELRFDRFLLRFHRHNRWSHHRRMALRRFSRLGLILLPLNFEITTRDLSHRKKWPSRQRLQPWLRPTATMQKVTFSN